MSSCANEFIWKWKDLVLIQKKTHQIPVLNLTKKQAGEFQVLI